MSIPRQHLTRADFNPTVLALLLPAYLGSATETLYMEESVLCISRFSSIFNLMIYLMPFLSSYRASSNALESTGPFSPQMKSSGNHIHDSKTVPDGRFQPIAFFLASSRIFSLDPLHKHTIPLPYCSTSVSAIIQLFPLLPRVIWPHGTRSRIETYG